MAFTPNKAMILAAGLGTRMRPITNTIPKPMVPVLQKPMMDYSIDALKEFGISDFVINLYHLGNVIKDHFENSALNIAYSEETERLETGGGIKKALPFLGNDPFFAVNGDIIWQDLEGTISALSKLAFAFNENEMDVLLLLHPVDNAFGYDGKGDFFINGDGSLIRRGDSPFSPYMFAGVQIISPHAFECIEDDVFSLNVIYDNAIKFGRLYGVINEGDWYHIGTTEAIEQAEQLINTRNMHD
ncbi:MAG: nucleotidyltransferase family protein [Alphaproteobacteria bacterium]|nr:nucleotidyltransferase family protein [Alphaproteobacteria bacterium]